MAISEPPEAFQRVMKSTILLIFYADNVGAVHEPPKTMEFTPVLAAPRALRWAVHEPPLHNRFLYVGGDGRQCSHVIVICSVNAWVSEYLYGSKHSRRFVQNPPLIEMFHGIRGYFKKTRSNYITSGGAGPRVPRGYTTLNFNNGIIKKISKI